MEEENGPQLCWRKGEIKKRRDSRLTLSGSDRRDDLLSQGSRLSDMSESSRFVLGRENTHEGSSAGDTGEDGGKGEGESPGSTEERGRRKEVQVRRPSQTAPSL